MRNLKTEKKEDKNIERNRNKVKILERSNRAKDFLDNDFWNKDLLPWIESERQRLMEKFIELPLTDEKNNLRETLKDRYTAVNIIPQVLYKWMNDGEQMKRQEKLDKGEKAIRGER